MNNFKLTKLSELVTRVKVGFVGSINEYYCERDNGVPLIRTTDIDELGINYSNLKYVTKEFHIKNKKSQIKKGDLIIARHGENGKANVFKEEFNAQVLNAVIIEPDQNKLESNLLKYYFDSPFVKKQILGVVKGSVQGVINTAHIADVLIPIIEGINYKGLSKLINDLDSKIELNNRINAELEAMAKTLYNYWFVQFDFPNAKGKPYKTSGGKMVWNEEVKREIPEKWEVKELGEIINIFDSKRIPLSRSQREKKVGNIPYYGATSIMGYVDEYIFEDDYILVAEDGSVMGENGMPIVQFIWGKTWVNNHAHVIQAKDKVNNEYIFYLVKTISVIQIMSGSIQLKINQENLKRVKVCVPDEDALTKFASLAIPIRKELINKIEESQKLTELRDWILPMLMNGQVQVK